MPGSLTLPRPGAPSGLSAWRVAVAVGVLALALGPAAAAPAAAVPARANLLSLPVATRLAVRQEEHNVALHKPCAPVPSCNTLVDGSAHGAVTRFAARARRRGGLGNGTRISAGNGSTPAAEAPTEGLLFSGSRAARVFNVYLQERVFVTRIIVSCSPISGGRAQAPRRRTLVIWTWVEDPGGGGGLAARPGRSRQEREVDLDELPAGEGKVVVFAFSIEHEASAVAVQWTTPAASASDPSAENDDGGCRDCGGLEITEVAVMALPLDLVVFGGPAAARRIRRDEDEVPRRRAVAVSTAVATFTEEPTKALEDLSAPEGSPAEAGGGSKESFATEVAAPRASLRSISLTSSSTLAASAAAATTTTSTTQASREGVSSFADAIGASVPLLQGGDPGFLAPAGVRLFATQDIVMAYLTGLPIVAWLAVLAITVLTVPRCIGKMALHEYALLPEADVESLPGAGATWPTTLQASRRQHFSIASPNGSRSSSPGPQPRLSRSASETEPDGEMEPASIPSSPRGRALQVAAGPRIDIWPAAPLVPAQPSGPGRVAVLYASPLLYRDPARGNLPMPQIPFEREWNVVVQSYNEAAAALREAAGGPGRCPNALLSAQPLTAASLQKAVAPVAPGGRATVLHLSAHGANGSIVLEDGRGTAHFCSSDMLRGMLDLTADARGDGGVRLVILNACSLRKVGEQFARSGVPHVICCSAQLRDAASNVFLCALYGSLFQGSTVTRAFSAAILALRCDAEAATQAAAEHFSLLPEGGPHEEVLFPLPPAGAADAAASGQSGGSSRGSGSSTDACWARLRSVGGKSSTTLSTSADGTGSSTDGPDEESCGPQSSMGESEPVSGGDSESSGDLAGDRRLLLAAPAARLPAQRTRGRLPAQQRTPRRPEQPARPAAGAPSLSTAATGVLYSPFARPVPSLPDDFLGRSFDVWAVLQHLRDRRAVVVCSAQGEESGVGKSAVLDAVHRAFALQLGGVCVTVQLRSLSTADATFTASGGWIDKLHLAVQQALQQCREQWWPSGRGSRPTATTLSASDRRRTGLPSALRRRRGGAAKTAVTAVTPGFHPLSDPIAARPALEELVEDMCALADMCETRCREFPAASNRILLLLDECDHLVQQQNFQDAVADVLERCASFRIVLSTHQRMVGTAGGKFKVVHHAVSGLAQQDSARLFLRRSQRPLSWGEMIVSEGPADRVSQAMAAVGALDLSSPVVWSRDSEARVLELVASHPAIAPHRGNPRRLIEIATQCGPSLRSISDLVPQLAQAQAVEPPTQEVLSPEAQRAPAPATRAGAGPRPTFCGVGAPAMTMAPCIRSEGGEDGATAGGAATEAADSAETAPLLA